MTYFEKLCDKLDRNPLYLLGIAMGVVIAATAALVYWDSLRPDLVLKKDDWTCTKNETYVWLQPTVVGNQTTFVPIADSRCVEYRRNA